MSKKRKHCNSDIITTTTATAKTNKIPFQSSSNHILLGSRQKLERQHVETRRQLPVFKFRNEICKLVQENEVLLVIAETVS